MTDAQLRDQAVQHLKNTSIAYPVWADRVANGYKGKPYPAETTEWGKAFAALEAISATAPPPPGGMVPVPPNGPFRVETGDHFYRDGDGLLTEKLDVPSAPGYGIANMRWPYAGDSTGTWVLRDCKASNVVSNGLGTDGAGFWIGEKTDGARLEAFANGWMNMVTLAACRGSSFTDLNLYDPKLVGLYIEHPSESIVFRRSRFGGGRMPGSAPTITPLGNSINAEWWYADSVYGHLFPHGGAAGSRNITFSDCEIYCPLPPVGAPDWKHYQSAGAFLDAGTYGYRFERCRFYGPGRSLGYPTTNLGPQSVWVDCSFDNAMGGPYTHDSAVG